MTEQTLGTGNFCWNELATRDAAASKAFYTELFGWGSEATPMPGDAGGEYTLLKLGEIPIGGLYEMNAPQFEGVPPHWAVYVSVEDVDATVAKAAEGGGKVVWGPFDVPDVGRMAGIADPTGAVICAFQNTGSPHRPDMESQVGSFCWAELHTNDTDAAGAFYEKVFGWSPKSSDAGPMKYYEWINGGTPIGGMMQIDPNWGPVPPNWTTYVSVADCDATVAKAAELGAKTLVPPTTIPEVGRFSMFMDPAGAGIAVIWLDPAQIEEGLGRERAPRGRPTALDDRTGVAHPLPLGGGAAPGRRGRCGVPFRFGGLFACERSSEAAEG